MVRVFQYYISPIKLWLVSLDLLLTVLVFALAIALRQQDVWLHNLSPVGWGLSVFASALNATVLLSVGIYTNQSLRNMRVFLTRLAVGSVGAGLLLSAGLYFFRDLDLWRSTLVLAETSTACVVFVVHKLLGKLILQRFPRRIALFGGAERARATLAFVHDNPEYGFKVSHIITPNSIEDIKTKEVHPLSKRSFENVVRASGVDLLILPNEDGRRAFAAEAIIQASLSGFEMKEDISFLEEMRGHVELSQLQHDSFFFTSGLQGGDILARLIKRAFDLVVAGVLLAISLPVMLVAGIAVMLTSKGGVFYRQERVGRNGRTFPLYKFRSMRADAEASGQPKWAEENDPRITAVGRLIRRTRIDELPQLINVFLGHMSMVGPRPERPYFVDQLEKALPFYSVRHTIKPGITGWAQIRYPYGASEEDAACKLEYDLYYVKNYSLFFDLLIILQTVRVVLFPKGVR